MPDRPSTGTSQSRGDADLGESVVRLGPLLTIPTVMRALGFEPEPVFARLGITLAQFDDPDMQVPYTLAVSLLAQCGDASGCEHFGLLIGERAGTSSLGIAGFMLRSAPTVRAALSDLVYFLDLTDRGGMVTVTTTGNVTMLGYAILRTGIEGTAYFHDLTMAIGRNIMCELCGAGWRATAVLLSRRKPRNESPYRRLFQAPVRFDAEQSALVFPTRLLDQKLPGADPLLHRHFVKQANELRGSLRTNPIVELHRVLRTALSSNTCSLAEVARQLGMHERTLNRRLQHAGTTFQRELDHVRFDVARHYLTQSDMTLEDIAMALGYADSSAFSHAFRRWSGLTPGKWRMQPG